MRSELIFFALVLIWATPTLAVHKQLETAGRTYPIVEPDIMEELRQKATGIDVESLRDQHDRYQPSNLHKLPRAAADRMFTVDMTYTLDHDIKDEQERLLYPHGFTIKPLQYATLTGGLVVVDGRQQKSIGMTLTEIAILMQELGAEDAMNLDGGGSSEMVVGNEVMNRPSDGRERSVGAVLAVFPKK